jgi:alkanesulfonate monooxygenase SsuD/methylene tetrahydromethanopterin reductase-like flavin-dependent oxidoreductase (luciferase family)
MAQMPAISLVAPVGRRDKIIDAAKQAEKIGFSGIYCPSLADCMSLCLSIGHATNEITFGTAIQPIYFRHPIELARMAGYIHEISKGRFRLGIGVSHGPVYARHKIDTGKPLSDMRDYLTAMREAERETGPLPPITLATLRDKMLAMAVEIADGAVWANGCRSHMPTQLSGPAAGRGKDFFVGDMIPTVISDDKKAAAAVNRKTLTGYVQLPNYRNYWKAAGYVEEMEAIEKAIAAKEYDKIPDLMSDKWLADNTLFGTATEVRDGIEAWLDAGVTTPIIVPSSAAGGQLKAIEELFATYS